jgi:hypothetical protein
MQPFMGHTSKEDKTDSHFFSSYIIAEVLPEAILQSHVQVIRANYQKMAHPPCAATLR